MDPGKNRSSHRFLMMRDDSIFGIASLRKESDHELLR